MQPTAQAVAGAEEAPPRLWKGMASAMPLRPRRKRRRRNDHKPKQILSPLAKRRRPRHPQRCHPEAHALRGPKDLCNFLRRDTKWKDGLNLFLLLAGCPISRVLCEKWDAANMTSTILNIPRQPSEQYPPKSGEGHGFSHPAKTTPRTQATQRPQTQTNPVAFNEAPPTPSSVTLSS
jgi:hypothetical protein